MVFSANLNANIAMPDAFNGARRNIHLRETAGKETKTATNMELHVKNSNEGGRAGSWPGHQGIALPPARIGAKCVV